MRWHIRSFYAPQYVKLKKMDIFTQVGLDLDLVTGYGADKDDGSGHFRGGADRIYGSEASVYAYLGRPNDPVIKLRTGNPGAGNFLVAREEMADFQWSDLKGKEG